MATEDTSEQVELNSLGGSYQMRGMPADDYPDLPLVENGTAIKLEASAWFEALKREPCLQAVATKPSSCSPACICNSVKLASRQRLPRMGTVWLC